MSLQEVQVGDKLTLSFYITAYYKGINQQICESFNGENFEFETGLDEGFSFIIKDNAEETREQLSDFLKGKIKDYNIYSKHFDKFGSIDVELEPDFIQNDDGMKNMTSNIINDGYIDYLKEDGYDVVNDRNMIEWKCDFNLVNKDGNSLRAIDFRGLF